MPSFASKPLPSDDKLRGGYYTPDLIAAFLARWVGAAGGRVLVRAGDVHAALDLVDKVGLGSEVTGAARRIWARLRDRRVGRRAGPGSGPVDVAPRRITGV